MWGGEQLPRWYMLYDLRSCSGRLRIGCAGQSTAFFASKVYACEGPFLPSGLFAFRASMQRSALCCCSSGM